nr:MAG TPA: hypothetical protein [Caudoviricetes sp.]
MAHDLLRVNERGSGVASPAPARFVLCRIKHHISRRSVEMTSRARYIVYITKSNGKLRKKCASDVHIAEKKR